MKEFLDVTVLALLQGIAEFLPISSSGHLVIGQHLLGLDAPGVSLDVFLHVGTLVSIFIFYRKTVMELLRGVFTGDRAALIYAGKILFSTIPAIVLYLFAGNVIEGVFENAHAVGGLLMFTGLVLTGTLFLRAKGPRDVKWLDVLLMGFAQAVALFPGVSRSGMTLAAARARGVAPKASAAFSFLMSAPLIAGAALLQLKGLMFDAESASAETVSYACLVYGAVLSAGVGYFALTVLVRTLNSRWFWLFGPYCFVAGLLTFLFC